MHLVLKFQFYRCFNNFLETVKLEAKISQKKLLQKEVFQWPHNVHVSFSFSLLILEKLWVNKKKNSYREAKQKEKMHRLAKTYKKKREWMDANISNWLVTEIDYRRNSIIISMCIVNSSYTQVLKESYLFYIFNLIYICTYIHSCVSLASRRKVLNNFFSKFQNTFYSAWGQFSFILILISIQFFDHHQRM